VKVAPSDLKSCVLTTDFFGFDTSHNHFKLQGLGDVSEMGDAILGLVILDASDPASPKPIGRFKIEGARSIALTPGHAVLGTSSGIYLLDVSALEE